MPTICNNREENGVFIVSIEYTHEGKNGPIWRPVILIEKSKKPFVRDPLTTTGNG